MNQNNYDDIIATQYEVLGHHEGVEFTEIRFLPEARSIYVKTKEAFVKTIKEADGKQVYVGINPRSQEKGDAASVPNLTCLVIDIDPVRPKDTASTPRQLESALALGHKMHRDFGGSILVQSGSGAHVYLPNRAIKVTDPKALTESLRKWFNVLKEKYATKDLKIDPIFDLPRIIRAWGSYNGRSQRYCLPREGLDSYQRFNFSFEQKPEAPREKVVLSETEERFERLLRSNEGLRNLVDGNVKKESSSEYDASFVTVLAKAHFSVDEIESLYHRNPHGNKEPKKGDVQRIVDKFLPEKDPSVSLLHNSKRYYDSLRNRGMGILTGIGRYDEMVSGLKDQKIYIIAARPTTGKTTLITQILDNIASNGIPCLFYPTEVGSEPIFDKIISRRTGISLRKFQNGSFTPEDFTRIESIRPQLASLPITIHENFGITVQSIEEGIKRHAPKVVAIDFFQALRWNDPDAVGEKSDAVRKFKELAGDYKIPIILASQLNRNDGKPDLRDLKGTGALEEFGDVISFLYNASGPADYPKQIDWLVMKSKYSETGNIQMCFESSTCKFSVNEQPRKPENR